MLLWGVRKRRFVVLAVKGSLGHVVSCPPHLRRTRPWLRSTTTSPPTSTNTGTCFFLLSIGLRVGWTRSVQFVSFGSTFPPPLSAGHLCRWSQSFHFAHTKADEGHEESIIRHERFLADRCVASRAVWSGCMRCERAFFSRLTAALCVLVPDAVALARLPRSLRSLDSV
jgi:hypothetical protein